METSQFAKCVVFRIPNDVQSPDAQLSQTVRNVQSNYSCRIGEVCNNGNVFIYISVYFGADVVEHHAGECFSFAENVLTENCVIPEVVSFHVHLCISLS